MPRFPSLEALNDWLEQRCRELWQQIPHGLRPGTIEDIRAEEARFLMPMPRLFDGFVEYTKRVSPTCLVHLERNRYSVPASFANRPVSLRVYPERIVVAAEGQLICEHRRIIERSHDRLGQTVYDWRHYLAVLQRKPGALRNGAPFTELPEAFKRLQQHLLRKPGGDREMVEILALVLQHDEQAVLAAVEMALEAGCESACKIGSDSISLHVKVEVAIFPRGNQRDGTEIWVDETGAGGLRRRACRDRHGLRIS
jgi:hypothetical protein